MSSLRSAGSGLWRSLIAAAPRRSGRPGSRVRRRGSRPSRRPAGGSRPTTRRRTTSVDHGRLDVSMTHPLLQRAHRHAGGRHAGAKRVPQIVEADPPDARRRQRIREPLEHVGGVEWPGWRRRYTRTMGHVRTIAVDPSVRGWIERCSIPVRRSSTLSRSTPFATATNRPGPLLTRDGLRSRVRVDGVPREWRSCRRPQEPISGALRDPSLSSRPVAAEASATTRARSCDHTSSCDRGRQGREGAAGRSLGLLRHGRGRLRVLVRPLDC